MVSDNLDDGIHQPDFPKMAKVGRNQPCPCGTGKKYKRCCGTLAPTVGVTLPAVVWAGIDQKRREVEAHHRRRQQQQGLGRPIVSNLISGQRVVAVGNRFYHSKKWHTFHDFLRDYLLGSLGPEWANAEQMKPVGERHPILRWYAQAMEHAKALQVTEGTMISGPMTGAIQAFMNLAYNIYLIAHHGDGQVMADLYLKRLKSARADDFTGALFETYAAAAFLKAGFKLTYKETERRSTSCVEFVAKWPKTGEQFSVEVKARVHVKAAPATAEGAASGKPLRVGAKLVKALRKAADHTRVVMIEMNLPETLTEQGKLEGWAAEALSQIRGNETAIQPDGSLFPPAYVLVTNHVFHHDLAGTAGAMQAVAAGFRIPDFGPDVRYVGYAAVLAARERHSAMMALIKSIKTHYEIPATFDGELPGELFSSSKISRLKIGHRYLIPDETGQETLGRLTSAMVNRPEKLTYGAYALDDGRHVIVTAPMTDEELADYERYPDTFFGEIVEPPGKANSLIEKCDFLFATYQHTSREKLLEFMATASDLEHLQTLGQRDLAIIYCERMAHSMENTQKAATAKSAEQWSAPSSE